MPLSCAVWPSLRQLDSPCLRQEAKTASRFTRGQSFLVGASAAPGVISSLHMCGSSSVHMVEGLNTLPLNCGPRIFLVGTVCSTGQSPLGCPCSAWRSLVAAVPFRPPLASRPLLAPVILPVVPTCGRALSASFSLLAPFGPCYSACWPSFSRLARFDPFWVSM